MEVPTEVATVYISGGGGLYLSGASLMMTAIPSYECNPIWQCKNQYPGLLARN